MSESNTLYNLINNLAYPTLKRLYEKQFPHAVIPSKKAELVRLLSQHFVAQPCCTAQAELAEAKEAQAATAAVLNLLCKVLNLAPADEPHFAMRSLLRARILQRKIMQHFASFAPLGLCPECWEPVIQAVDGGVTCPAKHRFEATKARKPDLAYLISRELAKPQPQFQPQPQPEG